MDECLHSVVLYVCVVWYDVSDVSGYERGRRRNSVPAPRALDKQSAISRHQICEFKSPTTAQYYPQALGAHLIASYEP